MRPTLAALALLLASPAMAANYATCILDKAPAAQNDVAAHAVMQSCLAEHPGGIAVALLASSQGPSAPPRRLWTLGAIRLPRWWLLLAGGCMTSRTG